MPSSFGKPSSHLDQPLSLHSLSPLTRNCMLAPSPTATSAPPLSGETVSLGSTSRAFSRPADSQGLSSSGPVPPPGYPALGPHPWAHQQPSGASSPPPLVMCAPVHATATATATAAATAADPFTSSAPSSGNASTSQPLASPPLLMTVPAPCGGGGGGGALIMTGPHQSAAGWPHQQPLPSGSALRPLTTSYPSSTYTHYTCYTSDASYPVAGGAFPPPSPFSPRRSGGGGGGGTHSATGISLLPPQVPPPAPGYPAAGAVATAAGALHWQHPQQHPQQQQQPMYPPHKPSHSYTGPNGSSTSSVAGICTHGGSSSSSSSSSTQNGGERARLGRLVAYSVAGLARGVLSVGAVGLTAAAARVDKSLARLEERDTRRAELKAAKRMAC